MDLKRYLKYNMLSHHYPVESDVPGKSKFSCALNHDLDIFYVSMSTQWRALLCECHRLSSLRHCPFWSHFMQLLSFSLSVSFFLSALTLSPHLTPSSTPHSLLLCSPTVPTERCHHPLPPKACLHPCHFFRWPGKSRPTGGVHSQPQPLTAAPATAC